MSRQEITFEAGIVHEVELPPIDPAVLLVLTGQKFNLKPSVHVTLASADYMSKLTPEAATALRSKLAQVSIGPIELEDTLYIVEKPKVFPDRDEEFPRESLVSLVQNSQSLKSVVEQAALDLNLTPPDIFPHVTVFYRPEGAIAERGIGISNEREWRMLIPQAFVDGWKEMGTEA